MEASTSSTTPEQTTVAPASAATPSVQPGNKKVVLVAGIAAAVLIVAILIVAALAVSGVLNGGGAAGAGPVLVKNTEPQALVTEINDSIVAAFETTDLSSPIAFEGANGEQINSAEMTLNMTVESKTADATIQISGAFEKEKEGQYALQAKVDISLKQGAVTYNIPADLVIKDKVMYFRVTDIPDAVLQGQGASLALFENRWLKYPIEDVQDQASGLGVNNSLLGNMDEDEKAELVAELKDNPLLHNAKAADPRVVAGITLRCTKAEANPEFFEALAQTSSSSVASEVFPVEICVAQDGKAPLFVAMEGEGNDSKVKVDLSFFNVGKTINVQAPTENVMDLSELIGSGMN